MIVTVTANPALDLTWEIDRIEIGAAHRADTGAVRAGGKGLNVARVAHAQGYPVRAVTTCGGATGAELRAELEASGVPHLLVPVAAPTRRSVAWVDRALGDTTIVNERGANPSADEWAAFSDVVRAEAAAASVLVISGSFPPGAPPTLLPELITAGAGRPVIVDTSGPALLAAADAGVAVLKPNKAELAEATGLADPIAGARELLRRGAGLVLLSLGADGMYAVTTDRLLRACLPEPLAGNPTGAGDAAVAAAATLLTDGTSDPESILRRATAWSAAAVLMPLAGEIHPTWRDIERALIVDTFPAPTHHLEEPA
ncbi:1-phosphofructokinase family hexose kinase [Microbacterium murale]|uniref:1-phosphofructokinase family hexose kinase n=1 Tax=Microbacterium murale TaxID=1081040 RepID=A0ABU0P8P0_9MICO|nr:1-phosphofructokinase family hexose kinase [Microbacterium murale]MDQ0643673.1 1-phosphofructokinase family hexose kinase [Microbacterium murale]